MAGVLAAYMNGSGLLKRHLHWASSFCNMDKFEPDQVRAPRGCDSMCYDEEVAIMANINMT